MEIGALSLKNDLNMYVLLKVGVMIRVCMKNVIHEHKNFIHDHHDQSMKVMMNDHKQSYHTYSMMQFIFYEIFQIKY